MATDILTRDEATALVRSVGRGQTAPRNQALLVLMWRTGLRLDEALSLRPGDLDRARGTVHVRRGKGNKARTVPIEPGALAIVAGYLTGQRSAYDVRRGSPLFCTLAGAKLKPQYVQALCRRLAERAGLDKHVHPHMFRHTYTADLVADGFDLVAISKLLGHSNLKVTSDYVGQLAQLPELVSKVHARTPIALDDPSPHRALGMVINGGRSKP